MDIENLKPIKQSDNANIFEATSIRAIYDYIQSRPKQGRKILAFDLDNTLMHPKQTLGKDEWFVEHFKSDTRDNTIALYNSAQFKTEVLAVESETPEIIQQLQASEEDIIIGLTARGKALADRTAEQLMSLNINFNQGPLKDLEANCESNPENGIFKHGIMFCDGASKGIALKGLVKVFNIEADNVYFTEDSIRHIYDLNDHVNANYTAFHYTHVRDIKGLTIDPDIVGMQIRYLDKILPDPVAKAVHEHHESELSNTHLKITFKQKESEYKPYAYFWANHEKDLNHIQDFFKSEKVKPKTKNAFFAFKPDHRVMACRVKVPLEKTAPLMGVLYQNHILKQQDVEASNIRLSEIRQHITNSSLSKLNMK